MSLSAIRAFSARYLSCCLNGVRLVHLPQHRRRIRKSRSLLAKLRKINLTNGPGACFVYLRQVDPYIVEECVLSAYERRGHMVLRNKRYAGDSGIDGWVWLRGHWRPLQVKRYQAWIKRSHVARFADLVARMRVDGGVLVHCGRSGAAVHGALDGRVELVSGDRLIDLLVG